MVCLLLRSSTDRNEFGRAYLLAVGKIFGCSERQD